MIRRFTTRRPALIFLFVLLWTFHFSFGMFTHYHPDYVHAHDGELQAHAHGGHFHSLELDSLARIFDTDEAPLRPGETHHHSETLPGSDSETAQYDFNHSGITKVKPAFEFYPVSSTAVFTPAEREYIYSHLFATDTDRTLRLPHALFERAPPLRV